MVLGLDTGVGGGSLLGNQMVVANFTLKLVPRALTLIYPKL